jgi:hypothetical protein
MRRPLYLIRSDEDGDWTLFYANPVDHTLDWAGGGTLAEVIEKIPDDADYHVWRA